MNRLNVLFGRGPRGFARMGLLTLIAGVPLFAACTRPAEPGPSKEEIWKQIYVSRLENLRALDLAFNELGQEYYKLEIEYKNAGREDLAAISRERAKAFHEQHLEFQKRVAELESVDARLRRGESALDIQSSRSGAESATPVYTEPVVQQSAPARSSAPSSSRFATPTRTPVPSPSGSRTSEPIIITDPRINNR